MNPCPRPSPRARRRLALAGTLLGLCLLPATASADDTATGKSGRNCGKTVINEYFNTGRISYHRQECYALAIKQVDPDAKMYSGIMGAIRAARARDKAKDARAAEPDQAADGAAVDGYDPVQPMPLPMDIPVETMAVVPPPVPDEAADDPVVAEVAAVDLSEDQAVVAVPTVAERVPLPVVLLGLLAAVLTLVGLGGLAVRWIDRTG